MIVITVDNLGARSQIILEKSHPPATKLLRNYSGGLSDNR
jgi:hypothetical protein